MKRKINILISAVLILLILPLQFGCNKDKLLKDIEEQAVEREIPEFQGIPGELTPETDGENDQDLLDQITYVNYSTSSTKSSVTEVVDQEQTLASGGYSTSYPYRCGQSFTPQLSSLTAISLKIQMASKPYATAYLELYEGGFDGTLIAITEQVTFTIYWGHWKKFEFENPVILKTDGTKYAFKIKTDLQNWNFHNSGNVYPDGEQMEYTGKDLTFKTHALTKGDAILSYTDNWLFASLPSEADDNQNVVKEHVETFGGKAVNYLTNYWVKNKLLTSNLSKWAFGTAGVIVTILDLFCMPGIEGHKIELAVVREDDGSTETSDGPSYVFEHGWFEATVQVGGWSNYTDIVGAKIYLYQKKSGTTSTLASAYIPKNAFNPFNDETAILVFDKDFGFSLGIL